MSTNGFTDWYQSAIKFVEQYQKDRLEQETDQWQKEREKYLEELKKELEKIEEVKKARFDHHERFVGDKKFLR